jgi:Golgi nucleoside diphosphatase
MQATTPILVGATAGLRLLPDGKAETIIESVEEYLKQFSFKVAGVSIIGGGTFSPERLV